MSTQRIHIHRSRLDRDFNVFLILIPIVIYLLVLGIVFFEEKSLETAKTKEETSVLGEKDKLDKIRVVAPK